MSSKYHEMALLLAICSAIFPKCLYTFIKILLIYMQEISFYRNESNITANGTLVLYERYDQKHSVRKVGM